jgi:hypothetical protein
MNRGTKEGTAEEVLLVKELNQNKNHPIWKTLNFSSDKTLYAIHVIKHVHSDFFDRMTKPKADIYLAEGPELGADVLSSQGFLLDENDLEPFKLKAVEKSGISVKLKDSIQFQILKTSPSSFQRIFGNSNLAAGASIYCQKAEELAKNMDILEGWNSNKASFVEYFDSRISNVRSLFDASSPIFERLAIASEIKTLSNTAISNVINSDKKVADYVFTGIGLYPEPYPAHWLYEAGTFRKNGPMPFTVTTGSGRSRGDYTIVIKPK